MRMQERRLAGHDPATKAKLCAPPPPPWAKAFAQACCLPVFGRSGRYKKTTCRLGAASQRQVKKDEVVDLQLSRGFCIAFKAIILSLQAGLSFACSVASLSLCPNPYLPGYLSLRRGILADCLLDQGGLSTCSAGHGWSISTASPSPLVTGG